MTLRPYKSDAEKFLIWREGTAADWQCTAIQLSDVTGLSVERVKAICKASRWTLRKPEPDAMDGIYDVCSVIERGELDADENHI